MLATPALKLCEWQRFARPLSPPSVPRSNIPHAFLKWKCAFQGNNAFPITRQNELAKRRSDFLNFLPRQSVALFPSNAAVVMSNDVTYPFIQDSSFLWLSGFRKPESLLVFATNPTCSLLFIDEANQNPSHVLWDGPQESESELSKALNCSTVQSSDPGYLKICSLSQARTELPTMLNSAKHLYFNPVETVSPGVFDRIASSLPGDAYFAGRTPLPWLALKERLAKPQSQPVEGPAGRRRRPLHSPLSMVHTLRAKKSSAELQCIRQAANITFDAFRSTMSHVRASFAHSCDASFALNEEEVATHLECGLRIRGAKQLSFPSIVAGGRNTLTIHYRNKDAPIHRDDLLLMDAGVQCSDYCSDMTRTIPVGGAFSLYQRQIYDIAFRAQRACIALLDQSITDTTAYGTKQYPRTLSGLQQLTEDTICAGLRDLGFGPLLSWDNAARSIDELHMRTVKRFFPHLVAHHIGMDVHDCHTLPLNTPLEAGMVLAIEPGVYIKLTEAECQAFPHLKPFDGIGVRIEDMVHLRAGLAVECLTSPTPKSPQQSEL